MDFHIEIARWIQLAVSLFLAYHMGIGLRKLGKKFREKGNPNRILRLLFNFFESHPIFLGLILWFFVLWVLINAGWTLP